MGDAFSVPFILSCSKAKFVKFLMGSYERAGWLGSRDLGFPTGTSLSGLKILPYEHFSPVTGNECGMSSSPQRMRHMVDNGARTRSQDLRAFFNLRNRGEISHTNPRRNWSQ